MTVTSAEQRAWQRIAAAILTDLLKRSAGEGLPVLSWTVDHAGCGLIGRAEGYPDPDPRAALTAWSAALGIVTAEHAHPSGMVTVTGRADEYRTEHGRCRIVLAADIWEDSPR